jgi:serine/threonine protein kinase/Flp pilus assembly protein TadD
MNQSQNEHPESPALTIDAVDRLASSVNDAEVIEALQEYRAAQQTGRGADRQQLLKRFPHLAGELSACLEALDFVAAAAPELHSEGLAGESMVEQECQREALGDFRLLREVGRGGMGVVYEAMQLSLGRRVALKVLPLAAALDSRQLQRFKNEAQAAAHLQHQHIVPVYAVGCERGVHYYAMQFIDGLTLAEMIHELRLSAAPQAEPTGPCTPGEDSGDAARPAQTATAAIASLSTEHAAPGPAHLRTVAQWGVQAALALEHAHSLGVVHRDIKPANLMVDGRGNLWITDFGLAHCQSQAGLTMSGDLIGTLRYMSPEQALAQRVVIDHRTDIYSLGATLYELLTLEPAFGGSDRQELLRQIAFEEPRPLRQLNRAIPAELETIVLKALEKNPAERYATAEELGDDLERWLNDEPIRARRPSVVQRLHRWSRRHRPVVVTAGVCLLVVGAMLTGGIGWVLRDEALRGADTERNVNAAMKEAKSLLARKQLPEALAMARGAETALSNGGGSKELHRRVRDLLADLDMVAQLEEIRLLQANVDQLDFDTAQTDGEYAGAFGDFGIDVEALGTEEAVALIQARTISVELAAALDAWAGLRRLSSKRDVQNWQRLVAVARLADPDTRRNQLRDALQRQDRQALENLAASPEVTDWPVSTLTLLWQGLHQCSTVEQELALLRKARQRYPSDFWINHDLATAFARAKPTQLAQAIRYFTTAAAIRSQSPGAQVRLGAALAEEGNLDEAIAAFQEAKRLQRDNVLAHYNLGIVLARQKQWNRAIAAFQGAISCKPGYALPHYQIGRAQLEKRQFDLAIAAYQKAIQYKPDFAAAHYYLGNALVEKRKLDAAIVSYRKAIQHKPDYAEAHYNLGNALRVNGQLDAAIVSFRKAIQHKPDYAPAHHNLGNALRKIGQLDGAIDSFKMAIQHRPDDPLTHQVLGLALFAKGQVNAAIASYREAIRLDPAYAQAHFNLGVALSRQGKSDEAIASYRKAVHHRPTYAQAYFNLGNTLVGKGQQDGAIGAFQNAIRHRPDFAEAHCGLGLALRSKGEFGDALVSLRRGHELGIRNPNWGYQSARWVRECARLADLERRLPLILKGAAPADAAEGIAFAEVCALKGLQGAAARLYALAFADRAALASNHQVGHRLQAARAAALAGCGQGNDSPMPSAGERARWRRQALTWLRADLAAWTRGVQSSTPATHTRVQEVLAGWQRDPALAGLRDARHVASLPPEEQAACQRLWTDVMALLEQARRA